MARRRSRITEFRRGDKSNIVEEIGREFGMLKQSLVQGAETQVARAAAKAILLPMVEEIKHSKIFTKLPQAKTFKACGDTFPIPGSFGIVPVMQGLTSSSSYMGYSEPGLGSLEDLAPYANEENRRLLEKARQLEAKRVRVMALLEEFLAGFSHADQVPFSLPEIHQFIPKVRCQKRPRYVRQPSEELRRLVREAGMLRQARAASPRDV